MGKRTSTIMLAMVLIVLSEEYVKATKTTQALFHVDEKLKLLNKPAVKSIKVSFLPE